MTKKCSCEICVDFESESAHYDAALEVEAFLDIHARVSAFTESQDTSDLLMGALTLEGGA